jgi:hypothetical protein
VAQQHTSKFQREKKITLMISTSWSTPLSPGKSSYKDECYQKKQKGKEPETDYTCTTVKICPRNSSAMTQPVDHKSMAVVYSVALKMNSGAR